MLKLKANPTFSVPVQIPAPGGPITITMIFKHMTRKAYAEFVEMTNKNAATRTDEDSIMDVCTGWEDVDTSFSREAIAALCQDYHAAPRAIIETYIRELTQFKLGN